MRDHRSLAAVLLLVVCTLLAATAAQAAPNGVAVGASAPAAAACAGEPTLSWDPTSLSTPLPSAIATKADLPDILFPSFCPPRCLGCTAAECRAGHCVVQSGCIVCC